MKTKDHVDICKDLNILEVQFDGYFLHKVIIITLLSDAKIFYLFIYFYNFLLFLKKFLKTILNRESCHEGRFSTQIVYIISCTYFSFTFSTSL